MSECVFHACVCVSVERERKSTQASPSIEAASMASTGGNGPYSNPLKDEGYKRFKCTETRGRKGATERATERGAEEGWKGPIPRLIESSFGTAGASLKKESIFPRNKRPRVVRTSSWRCRSPRECICFYHDRSVPERIVAGGMTQSCNL